MPQEKNPHATQLQRTSIFVIYKQSQQRETEKEAMTSSKQGQEVVLLNNEPEVQEHLTDPTQELSTDPTQEHSTDPAQEQEHSTNPTQEQEHSTNPTQESLDSESNNNTVLLKDDKHQNVLGCLERIPNCCLVHRSEQITLFCKSCDRPVCTQCIVDGNHSNHKFCKVGDVVSSKKQELMEILQKNGEQLSRDLKNKIKGNETQKAKMKENCREMIEQIDNHKAKLALEMDQWREDLQSSVTSYLEKHTQCLDRQMVQLQTNLPIIKMYTECPTSLNNLEDTKLLHVLEILRESSDQLAASSLEMEEPLVFTPGEACIDCNGRLYGQVTGLDIEVVSDSDNTEGVVASRGNTVAKETDKDSTGTDNEGAVPDVRYKFGDKPIYRIAPIRNRTAFILSEGKLYLMDLSKVEELTEEPKPLLTGVVQITPMTEHGIYVQTEYSTLINRVTAQGNIYRFADLRPQNGNLSLGSIGLAKSGNVISFTGKYDVTFSDKSVFAVMKYENFFHEYNRDGVLVKDIYSKECTKVSHQISDIVKTTSAVFFLDSPFSFLKRNIKTTGFAVNLLKQTKYYGAIGSTPSHQFYPRGMCQDEADHLIVSDYWNHALHQLTPEGQFRKFLMREEDGLTHPIAVAMDTGNCLWIGQQDGTIRIINYVP